MSIAAVPNDEEPEQQLWEFEGLPVVQSRVNPSSPGEFAAVDEDGSPLIIHEGELFIVQTEYLCTSVEIGAGYKGGIQVKSRKRIHHGKAIDGSQQLMGVVRR